MHGVANFVFPKIPISCSDLTKIERMFTSENAHGSGQILLETIEKSLILTCMIIILDAGKIFFPRKILRREFYFSTSLFSEEIKYCTNVDLQKAGKFEDG